MNKNHRAIFFSLIFLGSINTMGMVEKITYRNWDNCYEISNDLVRIVINASAGGRIMRYERNSVNVIYENPKQNGKMFIDFENEWFDPDGGRFDLGQESITKELHNITYMGEWNADIIGEYSLKITSQPDTLLGILSTRIFELDPVSSKLKITQIMNNISSQPTEYFFWGRTLVTVGGKLFAPLNPESQISGQWGRYIWGKPVDFGVDSTDSGVEVKDNIFSLIPSQAKNAKYGTDAMDGWMAYGYKGLLFIKKYNYYPEMPYTEHFNQTSVFYTNKNLFAEMEPISPTVKLNPGEVYDYTENWYLVEYPAAVCTNFDVKAAKKVVESFEYPEESQGQD